LVSHVSEEATYLAIDPGKQTGYAWFKDDGNVDFTGKVKEYDAAFDWLKSIDFSKLKAVIVEDFRLYSWKSQEQSWSRLETVKLIGAIEVFAKLGGAPVVLQGANIKSIGYMYAGLKVPKNHDMSHETDAFVHGVYYLQRNGIRAPQQGRRD
jgi:hypothetical protein